MEENKKSAASVEKEGEKVTSGTEKTSKPGPEEGGEEYISEKGTKKEESTGYNELPEQSKVGGG